MPDPSLILGPACFLYATRIDAYMGSIILSKGGLNEISISRSISSLLTIYNLLKIAWFMSFLTVSLALR